MHLSEENDFSVKIFSIKEGVPFQGSLLIAMRRDRVSRPGHFETAACFMRESAEGEPVSG